VHGLLAQAPFGATRAVLDGLAAVEARVLGLGDVETAAAVVVVERLLGHDVLVRARAADARGACRRETPVTFTMPDGSLVEGVVDLAFEEDGVWTVVDYKTDRDIAAVGEDRYRRQVALYVAAIARATGQRANGILMRV
jgi:ATP-dependent helicase/nuclease subunit A